LIEACLADDRSIDRALASKNGQFALVDERFSLNASTGRKNRQISCCLLTACLTQLRFGETVSFWNPLQSVKNRQTSLCRPFFLWVKQQLVELFLSEINNLWKVITIFLGNHLRAERIYRFRCFLTVCLSQLRSG
jgi:hypothetical protein